MSEELITPENLSKELLKSVFDDAFLDAFYDQDGDLTVKDQVTCYVYPSEKRDRIRFVAQFGFKPATGLPERLECVNHINDEYIIVKASVGANDRLRFLYDIPTAGGITRKALVLTLKRFCSIPHEAVREYGGDLIE
jgi:hypothetical protein